MPSAISYLLLTFPLLLFLLSPLSFPPTSPLPLSSLYLLLVRLSTRGAYFNQFNHASGEGTQVLFPTRSKKFHSGFRRLIGRRVPSYFREFRGNCEVKRISPFLWTGTNFKNYELNSSIDTYYNWGKKKNLYISMQVPTSLL